MHQQEGLSSPQLCRATIETRVRDVLCDWPESAGFGREVQGVPIWVGLIAS